MATERQGDRAQLLRLLEALDASMAQLRRDDSGNWVIEGRRGNIQTWGDDSTWVAWIRCRSARHWTLTKGRLGFMTVTQDGDDEGCLRLTSMPTPEQVDTLRDVLGLRRQRRYDPETLERMKATAAGLAGARAASEPSDLVSLAPDLVEGDFGAPAPLPAVPEPAR